MTKGWQFTFRIDGGGQGQTPVRVVIEGEVGDVSNNTWEVGDVMFYEDMDHAIRIAQEAVRSLFIDKSSMIPLKSVVWIETDELHPDHYVGLDEADLGVWI